MSELKAFVARKIDDGTCDPVPCIEVYPKSEADKCIDLLKAKANYNEYAFKYKSEELADTCRFYEYELRHQKFKRCLAMAKWCGYWAVYWDGCEPSDCSKFIAKSRFYRKWHTRWLKLAEKFKDKE